MSSATAAPASVSSFIIRAKASTMKLSPNAVAVPELVATKKPATARISTASHRISSPVSFRVKTPSMSSAMAPLAKTISGSVAAMSLRCDMGRCSLWRQSEPRLIGRGKACVEALDQGFDGDGGHVENRRRIEAEQDREHDERHHHR